jgi:polyvinyl alcohol dehydrogenase (cytochrome)
MTVRFVLRSTALIATLLAVSLPASSQGVLGQPLFERYCTTCHGDPSGPKGVPDVLQIRRVSPEAAYKELTMSQAHAQLQSLTDDDKRLIAAYLGSRNVGVVQTADAKLMPNHCASNPPVTDLSASPSWNGWGRDATNSRFQTAKAAGLSAGQISQLKLKWAFGFPAANEVYGQPTVVAGRIFIGVDTGAVYSLDASTGCVYWSFQADAGVRNAISVGPVKQRGSVKYAVYFGDIKANAYGVDAATGKLLWKLKVEDHPMARITGSPTLYDNRLYVPVSSLEERAAGLSVTYPCCTFRGSVVAVDSSTGRQVWKTYIIPEPPKPAGKSSKGVQQWAPAGGAVWNSPTIDPKRHAIYFGTGDSYTEPAPKTTDAVMALNMDTGKVLWTVQDTANDVFLVACNAQELQQLRPGEPASENCPKEVGPDLDFGASPILRTLKNGRRILVAGQKNGMVWAHDPDRSGAVVWKTQLAERLSTFGGAADEENAYFGLRSGGVAAVQLETGELQRFVAWKDPLTPGRRQGESAATTGLPGAVFRGGGDGVLRAFSTDDGRLLWEYDTMREFQTVNGVAAKGGAIGGPGVTVAGGMVFAGSGYVFGTGIRGNVLLAFGLN